MIVHHFNDSTTLVGAVWPIIWYSWCIWYIFFGPIHGISTVRGAGVLIPEKVKGSCVGVCSLYCFFEGGGGSG